MPSEASRLIAPSISFLWSRWMSRMSSIFLLLEKLGRIHDDQVKFFAFVCGILQVLEHIGADDFVLFGVDAVEFEIAFCPLEISVR